MVIYILLKQSVLNRYGTVACQRAANWFTPISLAGLGLASPTPLGNLNLTRPIKTSYTFSLV